jgi:hypothetical protein
MASNQGHSDHSSCPVIAQGVERPYPRALGGPPNPPIRSCSGWGLPSVRHHWRTGELLPRLFNLTRRRSGRRYVFCGTFPRSLGAAVNGHPVLRSPDFPPRARTRGAIAQSTLARALTCRRLVDASIGQTIGDFVHLAAHVNNTMAVEAAQ